MAEQINDGGSAFPQISTNAETVGSGGDYQTYGNVKSFGGITLRDYFAAKAMQALIQSGAAVQRHTADGVLTLPSRVGVPPLAYEYADAMLLAGESSHVG